MENSIEEIWKEGFINDEALIAPKINDLYNQKSLDLVDKFKRGFKINLIAILVFAVIMLAIFILLGQAIIGIVNFILFAGLLIIAQRQFDTMQKIETSNTSYEYLKSFSLWREGTVKFYIKFYRFFYPIFFLTFNLGVWYVVFEGEIMDQFLSEFPGLYMIYGFPVIGLVGVLFGAVLLAIFAKKLYLFDLDVVYGRMFAKLDEMIADMEELRR